MTTASSELTRVYLPRVCSPGDATLMVGDMVPVREPSPLRPGTVICDAETREPILGYLALNDPGPLRRALLTIDTSPAVQRANNYRSRSRTFGYAPRRPVIWREACAMTTLSRDQPEVEAVLESYADQFMDGLARIDMRLITAGREATVEVLPEWKMGGAQFWTSGVVNDTAQLPYHRDGFNFPVWSAMPVLRRGTRGGHLHLPEYDLVIPCMDGSVTYFEGFRLVHGVTPIQRLKGKTGYRLSAVYYALRGMKNCRTHAEESAYGRRRRTERETEMARRLANGVTGIPHELGSDDIDPRPLDRAQMAADWRGMAGNAETAKPPVPRAPGRQAFSGWRNTGEGDRPWNSEAPRQ